MPSKKQYPSRQADKGGRAKGGSARNPSGGRGQQQIPGGGGVSYNQYRRAGRRMSISETLDRVLKKLHKLKIRKIGDYSIIIVQCV